MTGGRKMKEYTLEDYVEEQKGTEQVSYILKQEEYFFMTGYKVLQGRERRGLVECAKLHYNGKMKLVYFSSQYVPLQSMMLYLDIVGVKTVLRNLISDILMIQGNGFLKCQNIDISPEKIFVDRNTLEVYLIYLPIKTVESEYDRSTFENDLRMRLIKLLNSTTMLNGPDIKKILFELSNGSTSLEKMYHLLQQDYTEMADSGMMALHEAKREGITMESVDGGIVFEIHKREFVIGKSSENVDGKISGNPAVSRVHCKVFEREGTYYLVDLKSSNGTYIDGRRLNAQEETVIHTGSRVRIANEEFWIK